MGLGVGLVGRGLGLGLAACLGAREAVCLAGLRLGPKTRLGTAQAGVVVACPGGALERVVLHHVRRVARRAQEGGDASGTLAAAARIAHQLRLPRAVAAAPVDVLSEEHLVRG